MAPRYRFTCRGGCLHPPAGLRRIPLYWWICREGACPLDGAQRAPSASRAGPLMRLFAPQGQTLFAPRFRYAQPWPHAHNPAPPRRPEGWPSYICRGGIHPSREVYGCRKLPGSSGTPTPTTAPQSFRVTCRGRACPARGLAMAPRYRFTCRGGCSHPPAGRCAHRPLRLPGKSPPANPRRPEDWPPYIVGEGFIPPGSSGTPTLTTAPQSFRVTCRGRACPARGLAVAPVTGSPVGADARIRPRVDASIDPYICPGKSRLTNPQNHRSF